MQSYKKELIMEPQEIKSLYNEFLSTYNHEEIDSIWKQHSSKFQDFWTNKILNPHHKILAEDEIDEIARILDRRARGNTKKSVHVANLNITPVKLTQMFHDIKNNAPLAKIMKDIFLESNQEKRGGLIDQLYKNNKKKPRKINQLTTPEAIPINAMLCAWDPKKNISIASLRHREMLIDHFEFEGDTDFKNDSPGEKIVKSNDQIINGFKSLGLKGSLKSMTRFFYAEKKIKSSWNKDWKEDKTRVNKKGNINSPSSNPTFGIETTKPKPPLNQILYGPPGTGKTYTTIDKALEILVPGFLEEVKEEATEDNDKRKKLKARYDNLVKEGRIFFVTFHQSFSYEDFIEGIKATTTAEGISYTVESGIFKKACEASKKRIDGVDTNELLKQFIEEIAETSITLKTPRGKNFDVTYRGDNTTITCLPHASKEKRELPASIAHIKQVMCDVRPENIYCESYVNGIVNHIKTLSPSNSVNKESDLPIILIIDEINRGNISSIFGEMITLIESSKRAGEKEALSVTLPYSKEKFQVPNNLYLIGTMNTADRSLALLDTALRRRFDFEEMMPDIVLLEGLKNVQGIDVPKMLSVINKRIEVLYDREHTLGHAFFMPLLLENDSEIQFEMLQNIFENKILPLLEEYFFEDWEKIRLVLGDNQKKNKKHQFIILNKEGYGIGDLFGSAVDDKYFEKDTFRRNLEAFKEVDSYIGIY